MFPRAQNVDARCACFLDVNHLHLYCVRDHPSTSRYRNREPRAIPHASASQRPKKNSSRSKAAVDLVFLQDATGSQRRYIKAAGHAIDDICRTILPLVAPGEFRVALVPFRDYPEKDNSWVTKNFGFTSDIDVVQRQFLTLVARRGGDGPEAQAKAMSEALELDWRKNAVKIVILITDSPPHGIGEKKDDFPQGSPDQNDPIVLARKMSDRGITLHMLACEPTLSTEYQYASDFYHSLVKITSGRMFPLISARNLAGIIIGAICETLDMEALVSEYGKHISKRLRSEAATMDNVTRDFRDKFQDEGVTITTITVEDVYANSPESQHNRDIWFNCTNLAAGRRLIREVEGPRLLEKFQGGKVLPSIRLTKQPADMDQMRRISTSSLRVIYNTPFT